jgi:hypothetical protein
LTSVDISLVSSAFNLAQREQRARLPQVWKKQGTIPLVDNDGVQVLDSRGRPKQTDRVVAVDAVKITRPVLRVRQVMIWRDLDEAYNCVMAHLDDDSLWLQLRVIALDFVDNHVTGTDFETASRTKYYYEKTKPQPGTAEKDIASS